jgi:hypothetical protein
VCAPRSKLANAREDPPPGFIALPRRRAERTSARLSHNRRMGTEYGRVRRGWPSARPNPYGITAS